MRLMIAFLYVFVHYSCSDKNENKEEQAIYTSVPAQDSILTQDSISVQDSISLRNQLVSYAETLLGIPYKYGSTDSAIGFDCSGFITHVFNHFNIEVPRSSVEFTNYGIEISKEEAQPGDLILFTGTDSTIRVVGHMGIIVLNGSEGISFIHSSSGKANGVVITPLNEYYMGRFVKIIKVLDDM